MADTSATSPRVPVIQLGPEDMQVPVPSEEDTSESLASDDGDEALDHVGQDDVESIIQPALSPAATRLAACSTPADEKAAALGRLPGGGLFSRLDGAATPEPDSLPSPPPEQATLPSPQRSQAAAKATRHRRGLSLSQLPSSFSQPVSRLPSPWHAGPKEIIVEADSTPRPALAAVFGQTRHRRSSSGGPDALKRLREALPSISSPLSSFFSSPASAKSAGSDTRQPAASADRVAKQGPAAPSIPSTGTAGPLSPPGDASESGQAPAPLLRPASVVVRRPRPIRRPTSDESMLYHSLSRVSSLGDDDRWSDIREQKNSRLKAITDSWDKPTFKLPQLPNMIPAPLKRSSISLLGTDGADTALPSIQSPTTIPEVKDAHMSDLDRALSSLTGDIVVMGGYRGSVLRSTRTGRQVWVPVKVGLNIRKVNLEIGLDAEDEENMEESIYSSGMLQHIGPVDISRRLFKRLRECENARQGRLRVWDYGYDWRLSPHLLSKKLVAFLETLPSNRGDAKVGERGATVIAHSLGGLITRHAVNHRPELFAGVIYAGTPQRCINILGPVRNGDVVLLNEKVLTAQVNFSLRTTFVFLPEDGFCFINKNTGEQYPIDFYNAGEWAKYCLSPCIEPPLPPYHARSTLLGSFSELSGRLPTPLRSRGSSAAGESRTTPPKNLLTEAVNKAETARDRTIAPQLGTLPGDHHTTQAQHQSSQSQRDMGTRDRNLGYLSRTLADTKRFRAETYHRPEHSQSNSYPPMAVMYGKEIPTVWAAHVSSREAIACSSAYDDLVFRSGDGVVLAREAMLPEGYELAKGGRISTDRGHITMLGDLEAVGRALQAVIRGRRKGIGLGRRSAGGPNVDASPSTGSLLTTQYEGG
ncbi:hypothetical protein GGR56DRAFT_303330 [Xylariaceae sp. FL0804]|nr:hypothetical protein GGR56DRAFT_303330 [Xylariaceae sp. FL0804]